MELAQFHHLIDKVRQAVQQVIVGKQSVIDLLLVGLISSGHLLLEDVPGTGKTLLAKALAKSLDCEFKRIQFTPDLLPSDLTGINFFNQKLSEFQFRPGPIFTNILLADEINRATPRTQSSLLECMEERQVTIDGQTHRLDRPFLVIATQNPVENQGTFPLPEAQLDRFMLKVRMGYPTTAEGIEILKRFKTSDPLETVFSVATVSDIIQMQSIYSNVYVSDDLFEYILAIAEKTRVHPEIALGVSPRGSQALLKAAQVYALLSGRDYVVPDDVKTLVKPVLSHRMLLKNPLKARENFSEILLERILQEIPVPAEQDLQKGTISR
ncbi:MAG: ATPase associated with various cellular 3 [Bacilli bacterium]|nr:ATPase associated with various cellular 3 [Bacilli bacterium]